MHISTCLWAVFLAPATAYALPPRQTLSSSAPSTSTAPVSAHPQPTQPPAPALVQKRFNTVCGFINGNLMLPATCDPGSHCAVDTGASILGCCPNVGACTTGLFTGCVDSNSGINTDAAAPKNPYIFTCSAGSVCYQNSFQGGFKQFGCGKASSIAATVMMSMTGITALDIEKVTVLANVQAGGAPNRVETLATSPVPLAAAPTTTASSASSALAASSSSAAAASASSSSSSSAAASSSPASSSATSKTGGSVSASSVDPSPAVGQVSGTSASATAATDADASSSGSSSNANSASSSDSPSSAAAAAAAASSSQGSSSDDVPTGAVVGGTLAGVAAVVIAASVGFWYMRRRQKRRGDFPDGKKPLVSSPMSDRKNFVPLASPLPTDGRGAYMRTPEPEPVIIASQPSPLPPPATPRRAPQSTMSYASSTYSRYLQPGALPSPTSPYNENGQALARDVNEYTNSYMQAIREETESNYSRQSNGVPPVPPMPKRPGSNWL